jgi:organic radical activating enzyme
MTKPLPHVAPWPDGFDGKLPLSEMFVSLQGEGRFAGTPSLFIRFNYCNLGCAWCDTRFTWDPAKIESDELLDTAVIVERALGLVEEHNLNPEHVHIVLTGGEPMLHQDRLPELIQLLKAQLFDFFEIETDGIIAPSPEMAELVSWWNCSPKLSNNGLSPEQNIAREAIWAIAATGQADFKFVITKPEDIDEVERDYLSIIPRESIILMPEGMTASRQLRVMPWLIEECTRRGYRFSPRLHVLAFDNERKR